MSSARPSVNSLDHGQVLQVDGIDTYVSDIGSGEPLLLIHGSGPGIDGAMSWDPVVGRLAKQFRVLTVDAPGYGQSQKLPGGDTPADVAAHLVKLLDRLGVTELSVVGDSRGGRIACELAFLLGARIRRLVILCAGSVAPNGHVTDDGQWTASALAIVRFGADGDTSLDTFKAAYRMMVVEPAHMSDELLDGAYETFVATRLDEYLERMVAFDPLAFYHQQDSNAFQERLRQLPMPVSVIWGREDETSSWRRAVELLDVIPDVEVHVLPQCSHFAQWDRPLALANLVDDFLRREDDPVLA